MNYVRGILMYAKMMCLLFCSYFYLLAMQDERGRLMRRIVMRYVCLCLTMVLSNISPRVKKRFPTLQHLVEAGNIYIF